MFAEVFLTAIAEPYSKDLRNLFALVFAEAFIERERFLSFAPAGCIVVCVPKDPRGADAPASLLDQSFSSERLVGLFRFHTSIGSAQRQSSLQRSQHCPRTQWSAAWARNPRPTKTGVGGRPNIAECAAFGFIGARVGSLDLQGCLDDRLRRVGKRHTIDELSCRVVSAPLGGRSCNCAENRHRLDRSGAPIHHQRRAGS
jgi:hypothetical protein